MYVSLNKSTLNITSVNDSNEVPTFPIPATADFTTEWIAIYKEAKVLTFDILPSGFNGTGTLKLEHTRNKVNLYDLLDSTHSVFSIGLTSANEASCIVTENFPFGFIRAKYTKGTNSTGTLTILLEQ